MHHFFLCISYDYLEGFSQVFGNLHVFAQIFSMLMYCRFLEDLGEAQRISKSSTII
jgi:hypothetical protein